MFNNKTWLICIYIAPLLILGSDFNNIILDAVNTSQPDITLLTSLDKAKEYVLTGSKGLMPNTRMNICFWLPQDIFKSYISPEQTINLIVQDERDGMLRPILKSENLVTNIDCCSISKGIMSCIQISVDLTTDGLTRWKDIAGCIRKILINAPSAIKNILTAENEQTNKLLSAYHAMPNPYNSLPEIDSTICYHNTFRLSKTISKIPELTDLLGKAYMHINLSICNKDNSIIPSVLSSIPVTASIKPIQELNNEPLSQRLRAPAICKYMPQSSDPTITSKTDRTTIMPGKLISSSGRSLLIARDRSYGTPKTCWRILFDFSDINNDKFSKPALLILVTESLKQCISKISSEALLCGSSVDVFVYGSSICLSVSCWNDTCHTLMQDIMDAFRDLLPSDNNLNKLITSASNTIILNTASSTNYVIFSALQQIHTNQTPGNTKLLQELSSVSIGDLTSLLNSLKSTAPIGAVCFSNYDSISIQDTWNAITQTFKGPNFVKSKTKLSQKMMREFNLTTSTGANSATICCEIGDSFSTFSYYLGLSINNHISNFLKDALKGSGCDNIEVSIKDIGSKLFLTVTSSSKTKSISDIKTALLTEFNKISKDTSCPIFDKTNTGPIQTLVSLKTMLKPDSIEQEADRLFDLAFTRQNWAFWTDVQNYSLKTNVSILRGNCSALLDTKHGNGSITTLEALN